MLFRASEAERPDLTPLEGAYAHQRWRKILIILVLLVLVLAAANLSLMMNSLDLSYFETVEYLVNHLLGKTYDVRLEWLNDYFLWNVYLPRTVLGVFLGAGLAICGVAMQAVMNNPLADAYTTGISDGACFGAVAAIVTGFTFSSVAGSMGIVVNAFIGGLIPAIILIVLSSVVRMSSATLILAGTALSYIFSGLETSIMIVTDAETLKEAYLWQIGTLSDILSWDQCVIPSVVTIVSMAILWVCSNKLNLLALGDDSAKSLGLNVRAFKAIVMIVVSVSVAALVSYVGIIGFIGLVAPHLVRMIMGGDNRYLMPASALVGSLLILVADMISRTIIAPDELRVGVIISMIGAPIFLYIILSKKKSYGEVFRCSSTGPGGRTCQSWRSPTATTTGARSSPRWSCSRRRWPSHSAPYSYPS